MSMHWIELHMVVHSDLEQPKISINQKPIAIYLIYSLKTLGAVAASTTNHPPFHFTPTLPCLEQVPMILLAHTLLYFDLAAVPKLTSTGISTIIVVSEQLVCTTISFPWFLNNPRSVPASNVGAWSHEHLRSR